VVVWANAADDSDRIASEPKATANIRAFMIKPRFPFVVPTSSPPREQAHRLHDRASRPKGQVVSDEQGSVEQAQIEVAAPLGRARGTMRGGNRGRKNVVHQRSG